MDALPGAGTPTEVDIDRGSSASSEKTIRHFGRTTVAGIAVLAAVALSLVTLHVLDYRNLSPIDELQHIDYLYKSPQVVRSGDRVGQEAMREQSCRGIDSPGFELQPCTTEDVYDPLDFQENGYNTASANTPLYYSITRAAAWLVAFLTPADNLVTSGRLVGSLWLLSGLVVTYAAGRRLDAGRWQLVVVLWSVAAAPSTLYPSATITPDAAVLLSGALALWTVIWWEERPTRRWPALAAVSLAVLAIKLTNIYILLALGLYLILRAVFFRKESPSGSTATDASPTPRRLLWGAGTLASSSLLFVGVWAAVQASIGHGDTADVPQNARFTVDSLDPGNVVYALWDFLNPLSSVPRFVGEESLNDFSQQFPSYLLLAGAISAALFAGVHGRSRHLAHALLIIGALGAASFVVLQYVTQSVFFVTPARYGYSLVPVMVVLTALQVKERWATVAIAAVAFMSVVATIIRLA